MPRVGLVHLVRAANGIEPLRRFLTSYERNPGGIAHDFIVALKGFTNEHGESLRELPDAFDQALARIHHQRLFVRDNGYDIVPYFVAAETLHYDYFCFVNSYSVILDANWLAKLYRHGCRAEVGIVGATGSSQSFYSDQKTRRPPADRGHRALSRSVWWLKRRVLRLYFRRSFPPFPNYHIRTNCFMIRRDVMASIARPVIRSKMDGYRFESGKRSMTGQIMERGLKALVVGKDGRAYEKEEWSQSNTFWQGDQGNLLVADNQTEAYTKGDSAVRCQYARLAWADEARAR